MKKGLIGIVAVVIAMFFVSGCETVPKKFREEVTGIRSRVDNLESKVDGVEAKQQEVERMTGEQAQAIEEMKTTRASDVSTNISVKPRDFKSRSRIKEVQACLKNAGFYSGKINGVNTKRTRKAVREFQKTNGLKVDGVVGPKTWELLSKYSSGSAEGAVSEGGATK